LMGKADHGLVGMTELEQEMPSARKDNKTRNAQTH
jgi:hypothetical protein